MDKRFVIFVVLLLSVGVGIGIVYFLRTTNAKPVSPLSQKHTIIKAILPSSSTKIYTDDSGFTFYYSTDLILSKAKTTDNTMYSALSMTSSKVKGDLSLQVKEIENKSIDEWIKKNASDTASISTTKLGEYQSKLITNKDTIIIVAIDQGVLFLLTAHLKNEKEYWTHVIKNISESFLITQPQTASDTSSGGESDVILEGEETVE